MAEEREVFARGVETERGVPWAARRTSVLAGGEDDDPRTRGEVHGRQRPAGGRIRVVGERHARQRRRFVPIIEQLDPIRAVAILVAQSILVRGHELGEHHAGGDG